jgi:hypothetical protein
MGCEEVQSDWEGIGCNINVMEAKTGVGRDEQQLGKVLAAVCMP